MRGPSKPPVREVCLSPFPPRRAGRRRAATASAVIPRGEKLDKRSCENGLAPPVTKLTRGLTALTPAL